VVSAFGMKDISMRTNWKDFWNGHRSIAGMKVFIHMDSEVAKWKNDMNALVYRESQKMNR
jgi:hypothetical protein